MNHKEGTTRAALGYPVFRSLPPWSSAVRWSPPTARWSGGPGRATAVAAQTGAPTVNLPVITPAGPVPTAGPAA